MASANVMTDADQTDERQDDKNLSHDKCEGLDAMYVKLVSSDNHEFILKREVAMVSGTISAMLNCPGNFVERQTNVIRFPQIKSGILKIVCEYFIYCKKYENSNTAIPSFSISPEVSKEVLLAANFLDC